MTLADFLRKQRTSETEQPLDLDLHQPAMKEDFNVMSAFKIVDTKPRREYSNKLANNTCRAYYTPKTSRLYISDNVSTALIDNGFNAVQLAYNEITGEFALVFNKENLGHSISVRERHRGATINSKGMIERIFENYKVKKGSVIEFSIGANQSRRDEVRFHTLTYLSDKSL